MPPNDPEIACYIARHGETSLNAKKMFRGSADPVLNEKGIKQAHNLKHLFSNIDLSCIFSSDKQRATKTAEILSQGKNIPVHTSEALRALNVGDFSGTARNEESEAELQKYLDDPDTTIPGGESLNEFKARIRPCIQEAVDFYFECGCPPLLVAHSSVVHEVGDIVSGDHKSMLVEPGGVLAVFYKDDKLSAEPIFRPVKTKPGTKAQVIT